MAETLTPQDVAQAGADYLAKAKLLKKQQEQNAGAAIGEFKKAGGLTLTPAERRGYLLLLRDAIAEQGGKTRASWSSRGQADIAREEAEKAAPLQTVRLTFPNGGKGPRAREMKPFTWVAALECYVAKINIDKARKLAQELGGTVRVEGGEPLPLAAE